MLLLVESVAYTFGVSCGIWATPVATTTALWWTNNALVVSIPVTFCTLTPPLPFTTPYLPRMQVFDFMIGVVGRISQERAR